MSTLFVQNDFILEFLFSVGEGDKPCKAIITEQDEEMFVQARQESMQVRKRKPDFLT